MPTIIAFTKDWDDVPTCTTHILRQMGKRMPVLWVESIGTRKPSFGSGSRDLGRIMRRLRLLLRGAGWKENQLWVLSPFLIPKPTARWQIVVNRVLFAFQRWRSLQKMAQYGSISALEYWPFVPNAVDLLPRTSALRSPARPQVVYFCVDDWEKFHNLDGDYLGQKERQLVECSDIIFAPARYLVKKLKARVGERFDAGRGPEVVYVPHGVDYEMFSRALDAENRVPEDIAALSHPIIGFYGNLHPWIDFDLVEYLATSRPDWTFFFIGHPYVDLARFKRCTNVHFVGRREHAELPAYCKAFDVAIIPYDSENPRMESVNPVKAREILAAGVPLIVTDIPELHGFGDEVQLCREREAWIPAIERQLAKQDRGTISRSVRDQDWPSKVALMREKIMGQGE